jgi:hypothetical protein
MSPQLKKWVRIVAFCGGFVVADAILWMVL